MSLLPVMLVLQLVSQVSDLGEPWRWVYFDGSSGLPSPVVHDIVEGADDIPWAVTDAGLAWYDGFRWHPFGAEEGLPADRPERVSRHPGGDLLVVVGGRLFRGGREGFRPVPVVMGSDTLVVDDAVGLEGGDLLILSGSDLLTLGPAGDPRIVDAPGAIPEDPPVGRLWRTRSGAVWLNTSSGLYRHEGGPWSLEAIVRAPPATVRDVRETPAGLRITAFDLPVTLRGLRIGEPGGPLERISSERNTLPLSFDATPEGLVVVAYEGGVLRLRREGRWTTAEAPGVRGRGINVVRFRPDGDLWIGMEGGLALYRASWNLWDRIDFPPPDPRNRIHDILPARDGTLWLATADGLVRRSPGGAPVHVERAAGRELGEVTGLMEDDDGTLWVTSGSAFRGAFRRTGGAWSYTAAGLPPESRFHDMVRGPDGELWFLGLTLRRAREDPDGPGVFIFRDGAFLRHPVSDSLPSGRVYDVEVDSEGTVWVGTLGGLSRRRDGRWTHWDTELRRTLTFAVEPDGAGGVWFADQSSGLGHLDRSGRIVYRTQADGLANDEVWELARDRGGVLWIATQGGLSIRYDRSFTTLRREDGVPSLRLWPLVVDPARVRVGTLGAGLAVLQRDAVGPPPRVYLGSATVSDGRLEAAWDARSHWGQLESGRIPTRYRVDDGPWSPWSLDHRASVSGLEPGEHRLEVQARGLLGARGEPVRSAALRVLAPLPLRPGFYLPVGFLVLLVAVLSATLARRRSEHARALKASRERYLSFFRHDLTGDVLVDRRGRITACNPAFARIFGFESDADAVGRPVDELIPQRESASAALRALRERGKLEGVEMALKRLDGRPIHVVGTCVPVRDASGDVTGYQAYVFDDTERKELEERLRQALKVEAVGRLAGAIAHDFNNLLTAVTGYAHMVLSEMPAEHPVREDAEEILRAGQKGKELTGQLLALGRRQMLRPRVLRLDDFLGEMEDELRELCGEDCRLEMPSDETDLPPVEIDPDRLRDALRGLVENAVEASEGGGVVEITLSTTTYSRERARESDGARPGEFVVLCVRDEGRGMTEGEQERMFDPFFSTKSFVEGGGLGLAVIHGVVRQSGGFLTVQSELGGGTRIDLHLPAVRADRTAEEARGPTYAHGSAGPILVVEDEAIVRHLAERILVGEGYRVVTAESGKSALALLEEWGGPEIGLVVMDVVLPDIAGPEVMERIRRTMDPAPPVLYVSGYTVERVERYGVAHDDAYFLHKPFTPDELSEAVARALAQVAK